MKPLLIAHRGMSVLAPENTLEAFKLTKQYDAHWIEFDVQLSKDRQAVVMHDDTLNRTTNGSGLVCEKTYDELCKLNAGSWFSNKFSEAAIPSLDQVFALCDELGLSMNLELKPQSSDQELMANIVMEKLKHYFFQYDQYLISSFDWGILHQLRTIGFSGQLGLLMHEWSDNWLEQARQLNVFSVHVNHVLLTAERIAQIKQSDFQLFAYTVNDIERAAVLSEMGVDGFFSDGQLMLGESYEK